MKILPVLVMGLVVGLSVWIMLAVQGGGSSLKPQAGANTFEVVITSRKVLVEQMPIASAGELSYTYRFLNAADLGSQPMSEKEFQKVLATVAAPTQRSWLLKLLNVSAYNKLWWPALGFLGQIVFAGRMWVQWLASERSRKSVVPPIFWYMSLAGGLISATYFIWRQDLVGVVGQTSGIWIYARNIYLMRAHAKGPQSDPQA
ncbi:MAG: lipid-A-disaccharide synthase N-terminal domain-containing protein [Planctomycetota bacterium]|nr:lipid-A-disaccharide synthase N-terminal domain-containing protein [Planctomycetota bacterium]